MQEEKKNKQGFITNEHQVTTVISLFSQVTGITLKCITTDAIETEFKPCLFCSDTKGKTECIKRLLNNSANFENGLFLCRQGVFRICFPVYTQTHLSALVLSNPYRSSGTESHDTNNVFVEYPHIAPVRLYKVAKLLSYALRTPVCEVTKNSLQKALNENNILAVRKLAENEFAKLVDTYAACFEDVRIKSLELLLTLEEAATDFAYSKSNEESNTIFADWLKADSLGKLKQCVNDATERFIASAFYPVSQKHTSSINTAILYIKEHYKRKITQAQVASLVYVSTSYFSKIFKETLGCSFNEYVNRVRIEKAKMLLQQELNIAQVAEMVGYENRSYFGKMFKAQTGLSPGKYRAKPRK